MAKNGYRVFDSDMHIMEPADLWQRYIAPEFRSIAPRGVTSEPARHLRSTFPDDHPDGRVLVEGQQGRHDRKSRRGGGRVAG